MKKSFVLSGLISFASIIANAQAPDFAWADGAGGIIDDFGQSIAVDASGNSYITGFFGSPTITFGSTTLFNNGVNDIFVARYDASGNAVWAKSSIGTRDDKGYGICADASGNSYITGYFLSPIITFGTINLTNKDSSGNSHDIFIVKYDASGNVVWAKSAGGSGDDAGNSICADTKGNFYLTGYFSSPTITFGTTTLTNNGGDDIFIAKYDASGNVVWAKSAGGSGNDAGNSICADTKGNSYITGLFESSPITFDTIVLAIGGVADIFVAKYDTSGNVIWAKSADGNDYDTGNGISADSSGNCYITGSFASPTITFGTTTLHINGTDDIFVAKYDVSGNAVWAKSAGGFENEYGQSISADASGNSYVTGNFCSPTITFGTTTLTNNGGGDIFIAKYDASGNVVWAKGAGGFSYESGNGIGIDASGNSYITGYFESLTCTIGTTVLTGNGNSYILIAKLNSVAGIAEITNDPNDVSVFPNPATNKISVSFTQKQAGNIEIYNMFGEKVYAIRNEKPQNTNEIDISGYPRGVYMVEVRTEKGVAARKFVKE